ncbi:MAG: 3-hydroxyacyl-CoA dehydrogenase [Hyphomicrobiaceae bacterium]|nr:3-hydroxyacyl-CoA dehydrogenase [Hyphomicrobiaceae bacterium]
MTNLKIETGADGVRTITWDMPGRTMNVLSQDSIGEYEQAVHDALADASVKGVIVTSAKPAFIAGADLSMMESQSAGGAGAATSLQDQQKAIYDRMMRLNTLFRKIEKGGKPFVAAINGTAMGGGLEVTLACHHRIVADDPKIQIACPESKVGLIPGAGGTQRMPRLMSIMVALPYLLEGKSLDPKTALKTGLVHRVVPAVDLLKEARAYITGGGQAVQPWDEKDFKVPGGLPHGAAKMPFLVGNAMLHAKTYNNYPAQTAIMSAVYEGIQVPIDAALRIEARYMAKVMSDPVSTAMIRSLFLNMQKANKGASRPKSVPAAKLDKVAILGAGMMGAGIAYVSARAGLDVVLIDSTQASADKGKAYTTMLFDKQISRGKATEADKAKVLARITPTTAYDDLKTCDMVIEAVFEDRTIKAEVTKRAAALLPPHAIFASNTSTLPITGLADAWRDASTFIGVHFFSPVDKMQLVEIIKGKKTGDVALATAMDYVKRIKKTPIVVNDSRGFYTSRCFGTYTREGIAMLSEGIAPALIENAGKMTGMPMPPLALTDEVALDLSWRVRNQTKKDLGDAYKSHPSETILQKMVEDLGRIGKKAGKGFYDYPAGAKKKLWPGIATLAPRANAQPEAQDLKTRLLVVQAIEAARCFEEGVVTDPADADIGAILGWGFAPWTGGPLSYIDMIGAAKFVEICDALAAKHGERFTPNALLRDMAKRGTSFYGQRKAA